uniref:Uncharacterized protein n=1 Tax=Romanomermis culicivorax TaxID=13658 RepID=A0A915KZH4_ROMCU
MAFKLLSSAAAGARSICEAKRFSSLTILGFFPIAMNPAFYNFTTTTFLKYLMCRLKIQTVIAEVRTPNVPNNVSILKLMEANMNIVYKKFPSKQRNLSYQEISPKWSRSLVGELEFFNSGLDNNKNGLCRRKFDNKKCENNPKTVKITGEM